MTVVAPSKATRHRLTVAEREIRSNRRRAHLLALSAGLVPGLLVFVVVCLVAGLAVGAGAGVAAAVAVAIIVSRRATGVVLRLIGGRPLDEEEDPRLANLVDGLCATFGVPKPRLWLVADAVPNACSVGRRPQDAVLVVTTGLLTRLGLIEAEGVVAHELAHVKRHDTAVSEVAVTLWYPLVRLGGGDGHVHRALGRGREYRADEVAAATVRYPPGLGGALALLEEGPVPAPGSVFTGRRWRATRWLWIDPMVGARDAPLVGELDATAVRRAALAEW